MDPAAKDYLTLFAEVAIAVAALSGIIMVLAVSGRRLSKEQVAQIATQLRMALIVTVYSLLPLLLVNVDIEGAALWRILAVAYMGMFVYIGIGLAQGRATYGQELSEKSRRAGGVVGYSALVLMSLNLWLAVAWPYLMQLTIALVMSIYLFLDFIIQILRENSDGG